MPSNNLVNKIFETIRKTTNSTRRPVSVYRLQFNNGFTFCDAEKLVAYLHELGITDCYVSPIFKARPGSQHGYDISDHNVINPEIGSQGEYVDFVQHLKNNGMGLILDIVPNHMSIFDNPKWQDVLENGPSSLYASFFDIDWEPVKPELYQKVLLPILEDLYGNVLENNYLNLQFEKDTFIISYRNHRLPIGPRTAATILEPCVANMLKSLNASNPDILELQSIITACKNLPERSEITPDRVDERYREKEIIKRRLSELYHKSSPVRAAIESSVKSFNGTTGRGESYAKLHDLLEQQAYRLSYWRVAAEEINYRRFFDINELVALRMENLEVFEETHRLVRKFLSENLVTGLRVDHIDGLFDPSEYLWRIQEARLSDIAQQQAPLDSRSFDANGTDLKEAVQLKLENIRSDWQGITSLPIIVEKILGEKETLCQNWPVDGTTGYEFAIALNQIFVNKRNGRSLMDIYRWFTRTTDSFEDIVYQSKNLVMMTTMAAEVNVLGHLLNRVSEKSWKNRDFTLNSLRDVIREVIACFSVYRTYIKAYGDSIDTRDEIIINTAVSEAKKRNPAMSSAVFDFLKNTLFLQFPPGMDETGRDEQRLFIMHFQQFTGPVMAKGVEDTAFYIYNPLVSLNEVGGNPKQIGASVEDFHKQNTRRFQSYPHSFITTSTHDTKRGEDVRARINVLSEIPKEWKLALARWRRLNRNKRTLTNGEYAPDSNEEYLLYQTLLGTFPVQKMGKRQAAGYQSRVQNYMLKAIREAKVHTSWISPNHSYENAVQKFVSWILNPAPSNQFIPDLMNINKLVFTCGLYNSLSQVVLKIFSPGVPDIYQGNEMWAFNLTDPDNRRPVDYELRLKILRELKKQFASVKDLTRFTGSMLNTIHDGRVKVYVTWRALNYRRDNSALFDEGEYIPVHASGPKKNYLCAFAWQKGKKQIVVVVPRLITSLTGSSGSPPIGDEIWSNTLLTLPKKFVTGSYKNIFTGQSIGIRDRHALGLGEIFKSFPVAVLENQSTDS